MNLKFMVLDELAVPVLWYPKYSRLRSQSQEPSTILIKRFTQCYVELLSVEEKLAYSSISLGRCSFQSKNAAAPTEALAQFD
jgi:hypothetical protein